MSFTAHQQLLTALVISDAWFKKLPEEYQKILTEASEAAGLAASKNVIAKNDELLKNLKDAGITVIDCDVDAFREACKVVYDQLGYAKIKAKLDAELER